MEIKKAEKIIRQLEKKGLKESDFVFNQSMPDKYLILQGDLMRNQDYFWMTYSTLKMPMKLAFKKECLNVTGVNALKLLRINLSSASYEDVQNLFNFFPDSIIEFSTYEIPIGNLKGRNTIIWEVRNY